MPEPQTTHRIRPAILQRSREFRHPLTPPEAKVWHAIRNRQVGFKFRRQHPVGRFIADFRLGDTSCPLCRPIRVPGRGW
jgi:very-short-patch-repair endonuclease